METKKDQEFSKYTKKKMFNFRVTVGKFVDDNVKNIEENDIQKSYHREVIDTTKFPQAPKAT